MMYNDTSQSFLQQEAVIHSHRAPEANQAGRMPEILQSSLTGVTQSLDFNKNISIYSRENLLMTPGNARRITSISLMANEWPAKGEFAIR